LQVQHYFSIALGVVVAAGSVAMLARSPRAAAGRETQPEQRQGTTASPAPDNATTAVAVPGQR
jgi:hypothetical protein